MLKAEIVAIGSELLTPHRTDTNSLWLTERLNSVGIAGTFPSVLTVSNTIGSIANVSVTLSNLTHTFPDDLDILLVSPAGDAVLLMSDACGNVDLDNVSLTFSDDAETTLPDGGFPNPLTVRPTNYLIPDVFPFPAPSGPYAGVLSAFNGREADGDWLLFIIDDQPGDGGTLYGGWSLTIKTILPIDDAPTLTILENTMDDMVRFSVSGRPKYHYVIESAPDLTQFTELESFKMPASGIRIFEYPIEPGNRFFRAVTDP